jgi:hypothetical protein
VPALHIYVVEIAMEETERTEETVRGRMPDEEVEWYLMKTPVNLDLPSAVVVADIAEDEEEEDDEDEEDDEEEEEEESPLAELLRPYLERLAACIRMKHEAFYVEWMYRQARIRAELCARGYVENVARAEGFSTELWSDRYNDMIARQASYDRCNHYRS